jgi:hypothetical protein
VAEGVFQTSFGAGELSPNLYAREDIEKYSSGAALMRNFYVDYRGGASNRPGTEFKAECYSSAATRLIPFVFSQDQSYVLEFSATNIRVYQLGAYVTDITSPYTVDALFYLKYVQSADVMTITHPDYPPYNLSRTSLTTFTLEAVTVGPTIAAPANLTASASNAGNLRYGYMVTALTDNGEESLGSFPAFADSVALDPTNATPKTVKQAWTKVTGAKAYNVYKWGPVPDDQPIPTLFGYIGQTKTNSFTDTNIAADYSRVPPEYRDPFSPGQITDIDVVLGGSGYSGYLGLTITGDGDGATGYAIADDTGAIVSVVLTNTGANYTTATVSPASGAATFTATIDSGNHYPSVVTYFQQRRVYGGADSSPELLEFSQIGAYNNFDVSPAVLDSDSITVNIASRQVNDIKALVPMSTGLIVFTTGCAFLVAGGNDNTVVTPASVSAVPQASTGSNDIPPITVNYNILFVQQKGAIVRDMAFSFQTQSYYGVDRSMLANHLFFGYSIVDWAWAEEPYKLLWVVRNDGRCLVMTYVPDQEVYGWSQHDTNGLFKSVTTVPEGDQDATYFVVRRFIQEDQEWRNYFERLSFRTCDCPADAAFLDSFVSVPRIAGANTIQVTLNGTAATVTGDLFGSFGNPLTTYSMEARQNYATREQDIMQAAVDTSTPYEGIGASQTFTGDNFDPVTRQLIYSACEYVGYEFMPPYNLWNGTTLLPVDDLMSQENAWNWWTLVKDIDTGVVTSTQAYNATHLVPAGIGGGDGTWRRYLDSIGDTENQLRRLINPRNQDLWQHLDGDTCSIFLLRHADGYEQIISPLVSTTHMEIAGLTADWLYVFEYSSGGSSHPENLILVPSSILSDETTADCLLAYASFPLPTAAKTAYFRWTLDFDKNLWLFSVTKTGTRSYKQYKFTPPTSAPYGGPVVGGGWTDTTPWAAGTGPNTHKAGYTLDGDPDNAWNKNIMFATANGGSTIDTLVCISKLLPFDHTADSHDPTLMRWDCTYTRLSDNAFVTKFDFVTGYMTAAWAPTPTIADAAYVVIDCQEVNTYPNFNDFNYSVIPGVDQIGEVYNVRQFFFTVQKVVNGAWEYNADNNHTVIVKYLFVYNNDPIVQSVKDEDLWYPNYAYTGYLNPMNKCMNALERVGSRLFYEFGMYDFVSKAWWWGGDQRHGAMTVLNPAFVNGNIGPLDSSYPLLRISESVTIGQAIDINCGTILVDGVTSGGVTGLLTAPIGEAIPDDPFNTIAPIPAGGWFVASPVSELSVHHLIGMEVGLLVDGLVHERQIVGASGIVTWPDEQATTRAVCGLPYQSQLKTMYLTTGEPTTQGRMKVISQVIVRVTCTLGIKVGVADFLDMYEAKDTMVVPYSTPPEHFQGDIQMNVGNDWNLYGQVCIQQDYPLPVTVLGVIPQVVIGDDD